MNRNELEWIARIGVQAAIAIPVASFIVAKRRVAAARDKVFPR